MACPTSTAFRCTQLTHLFHDTHNDAFRVTCGRAVLGNFIALSGFDCAVHTADGTDFDLVADGVVEFSDRRVDIVPGPAKYERNLPVKTGNPLGARTTIRATCLNQV